jgi:hypothetical protein
MIVDPGTTRGGPTIVALRKREVGVCENRTKIISTGLSPKIDAASTASCAILMESQTLWAILVPE